MTYADTNPFSKVFSNCIEISKILEEAMSQQTATDPRTKRRYASPRTDVFETADGLTVMIEMPGVSRESVDLTVEKGTLTVTGKGITPAPDGYDAVTVEFGTRDYKRSYAVSDEFDLDKIDATMKDGVLTLFVARSESAKPRKVEIR